MVVSEKDADKVCNKCFTSHTIPNCLYIFVGGGGWYHKANLQFFHILTNLVLVVIVLDLSF